MSKKKIEKTKPPKRARAARPTADANAAPPAPGTPDPRLPPPGTLLKKLDRHGTVRCECAVEEGGFRYAGELYRSLSAAAMAAAKDLGLANKTQNGWNFWGLTKPSRRPNDPLAALERSWERCQGSAEALINEGVTEENRSQVAQLLKQAPGWGWRQLLDEDTAIESIRTNEEASQVADLPDPTRSEVMLHNERFRFLSLNPEVRTGKYSPSWFLGHDLALRARMRLLHQVAVAGAAHDRTGQWPVPTPPLVLSVSETSPTQATLRDPTAPSGVTEVTLGPTP